jgi:3-dehydroquinate synthase
MSPDEVVAWTHGDKKARQGRAEYALVERIGSPALTAGRWATPMAGEVIRAAVFG